MVPFAFNWWVATRHSRCSEHGNRVIAFTNSTVVRPPSYSRVSSVGTI